MSPLQNVRISNTVRDAGRKHTFTNGIDDVRCLDSRKLPAFDVRQGLCLLKLLQWTSEELSMGVSVLVQMAWMRLDRL